MIYTLPFIAALVGWFTNFLAVKMLFHPKEKVKIGFLEIQGIFPKRQNVLAQRLGTIVSRELLSFKDIEERFTSRDNLQPVLDIVELKIKDYLDHKFPVHYPLLATFVSANIKDKFAEQAMLEIEDAMPEAIESYVRKMESSFDIEKIVKDKVTKFSSDKLEDIVHAILKKEFKFIEIVGAVLGFMIGLIQVAMVLLAG